MIPPRGSTCWHNVEGRDLTVAELHTRSQGIRANIDYSTRAEEQQVVANPILEEEVGASFVI